MLALLSGGRTGRRRQQLSRTLSLVRSPPSPSVLPAGAGVCVHPRSLVGASRRRVHPTDSGGRRKEKRDAHLKFGTAPHAPRAQSISRPGARCGWW